MMRIITGSARGTHLYTLEGEATRPTSERAKEALFSMLGERVIGAHVLDLFAGSGQLGLEALSRGAADCLFVDGSKQACSIVSRNAERTHLQDRATLKNSEALSLLRSCRQQFDLVFLDPPYAAGLLPDCLRLLAENKLLTPRAIVVAECADPKDLFAADADLEARYSVLKQNRYGAAYLTVLKEEIV